VLLIKPFRKSDLARPVRGVLGTMAEFKTESDTRAWLTSNASP
jgi:hypothetical protein